MGDEEKLRTPVTVRIGITGYHKPVNEQLIRAGMKRALGRLDKMLHHTPHTFVAISLLSRGVERVMTKEVLAWPVSKDMDRPALEVVLPLPEADYLQDIETEESKQEFLELLKQAKSRHSIEEATTREAAYERASQLVVRGCDVLVAVWDGKSPGQDETDQAAKYARQVGRSVFWINSRSGGITEERHEDKAIESLENLDAYNSEHLGSLETELEAQFNIIAKQAKNSGFSSNLTEPLRKGLLPHFVRADLLAQRYHTLHMRAGSAIYALAAAAVATVTVQVLFFEQLHGLLWLEVAEMALILLLLAFSRVGNWHGKWIDYRSLAEYLRAAIFLRVANMKYESADGRLQPRFSHRPDDWVVKAFAWVWNAQPQAPPDREVPLESLKNFLLASWIEDQVYYYRKTSKQHRRRHTLLSRGGEVLFALTLVMAVIHAAGLVELGLPSSSTLPNIILSLSVILPAVAAALASIRVHREYLRNAEQYGNMARHLSAISDEIKRAPNIETLASLLEEANQVMLREHQSWREVVLFRKLETP